MGKWPRCPRCRVELRLDKIKAGATPDSPPRCNQCGAEVYEKRPKESSE